MLNRKIEKMKQQTVWVTGSKGQLGSEIQACQMNFPEYRFIFTDITAVDITDKEAVLHFMAQNPIDFIINCAAYTAVDKAETEKESAALINVSAVENLASVAELHHCKMVHISTDYVFDGMNYKPYTELDTTAPQSVYGITKLQGEQIMHNHPISAVIIRTSWLYSSFGNNFVKTILKIAKEKGALNVVCDQIGTPTYAADLAFVVLNMLAKIPDNKIEIYHFSNEGVCSWYDFAKEIVNMADVTCKITPIPASAYSAPAPRPYYSVFDKTKIKQELPYEIAYWKDSLRKCMEQL